MNKKKLIAIISCVLLIAILVTTGIFVIPMKAANVTKYSYSSDTPFFEYYDAIPADNESSVDYWYDKFPVSENKSNFSSLSTTTFENINGKTVYVDNFYRNETDALNDPNYGEGILLYECIHYKMAHPDEEVYIDFTTYRMSVSEAVCVKRDSRYFGYMRSLFDREYDSHGFVRISFMLVEAARLGIHVNLVPHLNAYATQQYSSTASSKHAKGPVLQFSTYFSDALKKSCYTGYAKGKKVSDYMKYAQCDWLVNENGSSDMMHCKICAVSAYVDYLGNEYSSGVFLTSSNQDQITYLGRNGQGGAQSGVILSNHDAIYRAVHNYVGILTDYCGVEDAIIFRDVISKMNKEQVDLLLEGKGDQIPADKQIAYVGTESDDIFEFYFTPLAGSVGVWDTTYNPYSKFFTNFGKSEGPVELVWCVASYSFNNIFARTIEDLVIEEYHKNPSTDNILFLHLPNYEKSYAFNDLTAGENIGYKFIGDIQKVHSKDTILSYVNDGVRHYTSIMTSCNFHLGAMHYQANHFLIIKETEETGHTVYDTVKHSMSKGNLGVAITRDAIGE